MANKFKQCPNCTCTSFEYVYKCAKCNKVFCGVCQGYKGILVTRACPKCECTTVHKIGQIES